MSPDAVSDLAQTAATPTGLLMVIVILSVVMAFLLGVVGYLLKDMRATVRDRLNANSLEIQKVWEHLGRHERTLPLTYVLRDEFVRAMAGFDRKLDCVYEAVDELRKEKCKHGSE